MRINSHVIQYIAAAIIVMILGGFVGWFVFVRGEINSTNSLDTARGTDTETPSGGGLGSSITNFSGGAHVNTAPGEESGGGLWARLRNLFQKSGAPSFGGTGSFGDAPDTGNASPSGATPSGTPTRSQAPRLWRISATPVAGAGFASSTPQLFFAERASGNILRAHPDKTQIERLTNTLFPKTIDAHFATDGSVVLRFLGESGETLSYAGRIATSTSAQAGDAPNKLEGVYLPRDILSIDAGSAPNTLFFLIGEGNGSSGVTANWQGGAQKKIFTSPLLGWRLMLEEGGAMYLLQKASDDVDGFFYRVQTNGALEKVVGGLPGLLALPKARSSALIYSTSDRGTLSLYARSNRSSTDTLLPLKTVAEKCVWAPGNALVAYCAVPENAPQGSYLRDWYSGTVHTKDTWWRVDVGEGRVEQLNAPHSDMPLDVTRPTIDASGRYIAFINGVDQSLWLYALEQ